MVKALLDEYTLSRKTEGVVPQKTRGCEDWMAQVCLYLFLAAVIVIP